jgi:SAM-dependent methyltransferase
MFCGSLERHRFQWLWLQQTDLFCRAQSLLHIAPEPMFQKRLRRLPHLHYVTTDLVPDRWDNMNAVADLTCFGFADQTFDTILCSHILEHIPDDYTAMREMRRVLKPGGWCLISVPPAPDQTTEDLDASEAERTRRFGHPEHVRLYGPDIADRLRASGFTVEVVRSEASKFPEKYGYTWNAMGLNPEALYICTCSSLN